MAQSLTPQQNAATQKNVQTLLDARGNQVQVPTTKGTFHNTANGWVNTSAGVWSANPKLENYSIFSVKWGPARRAFTRQGETAQSIVGKSHLYMYFGVDRLFSRNIPNFRDMSHGNNMFSFGSVCPSYIILADAGWTTNPANWCVPLTPSMFEVNSAMVPGSQVDEDGYITPPNAEAAYYTGWVETPWSNSSSTSDYEMFASFWKCWDGSGRIALVLYRGPYTSLPFLGSSAGTNMPYVEVVDPDDSGSLETRPLFLTEVISEFYTIFDEIDTVHGIVGIAQGHSGSLQIETDLLNPPALALRGHLFTYGGSSFMIPAMAVPENGLYTQSFGSEMWWTTDSLKYKGSNVFIRTSQLDAQEMLQIATGQYNWGGAVQQTDGLLKLTSDDSMLVNSQLLVYLPQAGVADPVGPNAQSDADSDRRFDVSARVLLDKRKNLYFLQFWNPHPMAQNHAEPSIPADCTPATNWFIWTSLEQANYKNSAGKYIGKSCLFRPTDTVVGRLEITDVVTDAYWSGWLSAGDQGFFSVDHNDELSGAGEGHSPWTRILELYKFHDLEYAKERIEAQDQYLVRHVEDGGAVLQYAPLSSRYPAVDTQKELSVDQNSIDYADLSGDLYLQLYKFPDGERIETQAVLSDTTDVVLRHRYMQNDKPVVEVDYLSAGAVVNPVPDSSAQVQQGQNPTQSLETAGEDRQTGREVWQIYKFRDSAYKSTFQAMKDAGAEVIVRDGGKVNYFPVSEISAGGGGGLSGTVSFLGDLQYDIYSHQLQKRVDTLDLATGQVTPGQWTIITGGQAVAHSTVAD